MTKEWWRSKTLWVNIIAVIVIVVQGLTGFVITPEAQAGILAILNLILRLQTEDAIER